MVSASGLDDGLGAFRPSTSFNDFGALLKDEPSSTPSSPGGSVVADSPEAEAAKAAGTKCGKRGGTRAATRAADKAAAAGTTSAKKKVKTATGLGKTGGILSPSPAKGAVGSTKKRSRPSTSPKASDASAKKSKTVAGTASCTAKSTAAPAGKGTIVHPVSPNPAGKTTKPVAGAKGTVVTANGKVVTNPLTPGSKAAAAAAAAKSSASTAAASAAAAAKTVSTARRLITSTTSTTAVAVKAPAPGVTSASAAAAAAARAAAAKAAAASAQAKANKELTEHDFRGVAQAAVKNLMMSVGGKSGSTTTAAAPSTAPAAVPAAVPSASVKPTPAAVGADKKPINTSSSHIAALTSSNWVQACSEGVGDAAQAAALAAAAAANDPAQSKAARARRANLTPDERARQNRDRNREHARNTRLRKKAYVEELKKTLTELVAQRDAAELERRHEAQRDLEVREVRFRVMEEFLKLRSQGDNPNLLTRWSAIMEDGFTLSIPKTDYRPIVAGQTSMRRAVSIDATSSSSILSSDSLEQILRGPNQVMEDASNLASFVNTFGDSTSNAGPVRFAYHCERKNFMMDGVNAILHWTASTAGAVAKGAPSELVVKGMMKANFSPASNKLNSAELLFDTGCVTSQARSLITTPTVVTTSQILSSALSVTDRKNNADVDMAVNDADALLDSLQMPHVTSSGNMSTVVSTASMDGTNTPAISSCDEGEVSESAQSGPATRRSTRIH